MIEKLQTVKKGETFASKFTNNKDIVAVTLNGQLHDLSEVAMEDCQVQVPFT